VFDVFELIFQMLILPAGLAWAVRKYVPIRNAFTRPLAIVFSAALPALWIFYETQQADSITRAASVVVTPVLFLIMLIPAAVGYALARPKAQS